MNNSKENPDIFTTIPANPTTNDITYYKILKDTILYHGSSKIKELTEFNPNHHTFFALSEEYARTYATDVGIVFAYRVLFDFELVALDLDNDRLYQSAPDNIREIMDEQYGFHNRHKRKSHTMKDNELSIYLCQYNRSDDGSVIDIELPSYNGYATNKMYGETELDDLPPELVICDKCRLECIDNISHSASL
jgi:hypothetical protein